MRTAPALLTLALAACGGGKKNPDAPPGGDGDGPIGPVLDGRELGRLAAEGLNEYGVSQNQPIIATSLVG